ncbi:hypothetical protein Mapa_015466 [Marchantia paleacea]|nr:hypothetical protein Mapa_015466 [Marchantia paleacea]
MSLALVADYSSSEEEENRFIDSEEDSEHELDAAPAHELLRSDIKQPLKASLLPSPDDMFQKVTGPPEFLKSSATEPLPSRPRDNWNYASDTARSAPNSANGLQAAEDLQRTLTSGAIIQAKAVLVDDLERMRNDPVDGATEGKDNSRRVPGVNMPPPEDAAALLRMCVKCGVPKTYSGSKESMVCPLCGDRPAGTDGKSSTAETEKRSGSKIKDKEKNKRMKGQSSHATWKSETEMQLRQQFD